MLDCDLVPVVHLVQELTLLLCGLMTHAFDEVH